MIETITPKDFIHAISQDSQVAIFFCDKSDKETKKIEQSLAKIKNESPALKIFQYELSRDEQHEEFENTLEIMDENNIVVFKNCCFNRYKNKQFTEKSLKTFLSVKKIKS